MNASHGEKPMTAPKQDTQILNFVRREQLAATVTRFHDYSEVSK